MSRLMVLKEQLHMVAPDVTIDDGKGTILISSEEGETEANNDKPLAVFNVHNGSRLVCDDFHQNYQLAATIYQSEDLPEGVEFQVVGDVEQLKAAQDENGSSKTASGDGTSNKAEGDEDGDDDILVAEEPELEIMEEEATREIIPLKRPVPEGREGSAEPNSKKLRLEESK